MFGTWTLEVVEVEEVVEEVVQAEEEEVVEEEVVVVVVVEEEEEVVEEEEMCRGGLNCAVTTLVEQHGCLGEAAVGWPRRSTGSRPRERGAGLRPGASGSTQTHLDAALN